jgi:hypothetical protein
MRKHPANLCQSPRSKSRHNPSLKWRRGIRIISVEENRTHNGRLVTMGFWACAGATGGRLKNPDSHHPEQKERVCIALPGSPGQILVHCIYNHEAGGYSSVTVDQRIRHQEFANSL